MPAISSFWRQQEKIAGMARSYSMARSYNLIAWAQRWQLTHSASPLS